MVKNYIKTKSLKQDRKISLSQGFHALVSEEDYNFLMQWNWYYNKGYAYRTEIIEGKQVGFYMHRVILNAPKGVLVDHKFGNTLDNRRSKIRLCTSSQNAFNAKKPLGKTSKYRGVCWSKSRNKWEGQIKIGSGKKKFLGYFEDEVECAKAYNDAIPIYHGEFGVLNEL